MSHNWNQTEWLISFNFNMHLSFFHVSLGLGRFFFFFFKCWIILHCLTTKVYPFTYWRTVFAIGKKAAIDTMCRFVCGDKCQLLWVYTKGCNYDCMVRVSKILWETAKLSAKAAVPFCSRISEERCLLLYITTSIWGVRYVAEYHCYFNFQFPNDIWCWISITCLLASVYLLWWGVCSGLFPF